MEEMIYQPTVKEREEPTKEREAAPDPDDLLLLMRKHIAAVLRVLDDAKKDGVRLKIGGGHSGHYWVQVEKI